MNKDVLISIQGLQYDMSEEDTAIKTITPATYYKKEGRHYVVYEEAAEGSRETTRNILKWNEDMLDLTKYGTYNVHMLFEKNKKNLTDYRTPFGGIMVGIDTHSIEVRESESEINLQVEYSLDINYEQLAECRINISVTDRDRCDWVI